MGFEEQHKRQLEHLQRQQQIRYLRLERQRQQIEKQHERLNARQARIEQKLHQKREDILEAALELLDEEGINELTLRKLAQKLHIQAPALYWYFKNKEDLVDYMAEAILESHFHDLTPRRPGESWQEWLISACQLLRDAMLAHRDGGRVVAGAHLFPAVSLVRLLETAGESLSSAGLDERRADLIISTAVHFTFGRVIEEQSSPSAEQLAAFDFGDFLKNFPHTAAGMERTKHDLETGYDEFEDALRLIIHD